MQTKTSKLFISAQTNNSRFETLTGLHLACEPRVFISAEYRLLIAENYIFLKTFLATKVNKLYR